LLASNTDRVDRGLRQKNMYPNEQIRKKLAMAGIPESGHTVEALAAKMPDSAQTPHALLGLCIAAGRVHYRRLGGNLGARPLLGKDEITMDRRRGSLAAGSGYRRGR
jgi:hypothetical protein